jgi:hypothetical protein
MTPASISPATKENVIFPFVQRCFTDIFTPTGFTNRVMHKNKRTQNSSLQDCVTAACSPIAAIQIVRTPQAKKADAAA